MKRGDEEPALAQEDRLAPVLGKHVDVHAGVPETRRADEDTAQRALVAGDAQVGFEARDLPAVGIPLDLDVDQREVVAVEDDHAGARSEYRAAELPHSLVEAV